MVIVEVVVELSVLYVVVMFYEVAFVMRWYLTVGSIAILDSLLIDAYYYRW